MEQVLTLWLAKGRLCDASFLVRDKADVCALLVRLIGGQIPDKYRTNTGQLRTQPAVCIEAALSVLFACNTAKV